MVGAARAVLVVAAAELGQRQDHGLVPLADALEVLGEGVERGAHLGVQRARRSGLGAVRVVAAERQVEDPRVEAALEERRDGLQVAADVLPG